MSIVQSKLLLVRVAVIWAADILAQHSAGRVKTSLRQQLLDAVWGPDWYGDDHVVDVHMGNLRKKLGESGSNPRFIHTVRGVGFRFEATS